MASKGNKPSRFKAGQRIAYFDTLDRQHVESVIDNLLSVTQLPYEVKVTLQESMCAFLLGVINDVNHLKSVHSLNEYYDACKRRYDDLSDLCSLLLTADDGEGVLVNRINSEGGKKIYLIGRNNRRICVTSNNREYYIGQRKPGTYRFLFRIVPEIVEYLNYLRDNSEFEDDQYKQAMKDLSIVITTIAKVYEDIRGGDLFRESENQLTISRMSRSHTLDHDSEYWLLFQQFKSDIEEARMNPRSAKRYIKDITRALPTELRKFEYKDFHLSFKKTGTMLNGQPIPGLYASLVETDDTSVSDDLIGYTSNYNKSVSPGVEQATRKSVLIPQHKLPLRLIHMASNPIQDRCTFYHNRMMDFLNQLRVDCTIDQSKGVTFARLVSSPKYRSVNKNNIYCLDISKATDTLNQEFQKECVELLFGPEHADNWSNLVSGPSKFISNGKTIAIFEQQCGQPQGYKSSFPAFAWVHHVIMRLVMLKHGLEDMEPSGFYRVLGDDSIISYHDPDRKIFESYIAICQFVNWDCNPSKGYTFIHSVDDCAFAEFAKVRILDGEYCTPIPIRLLVNSIKSPLDYVTYQWWITKYYRPVSIHQVIDGLYRKHPNSIIDTLASAMVVLNTTNISIFGDFENESPEELPDEYMSLTLLAYTKSKLRQTLLNQFIPDNLLTLSDKEKTEIVSPFLGSKMEEKLLNLVESSEHKYVQLLEANEDIINTLASVFDETKVSLPGVIALNLSEQEKDYIYTACEMLLNIQEYGVLPPYDEISLTLTKALDILNRYNVRSDRNMAKMESELLVNFCETISQYIEAI